MQISSAKVRRRGSLVLGRVDDFALLDVWFEAFIEIARANASSGNGGNKQRNRNDSKDCQGFPRRQVLSYFLHVALVIHAHELEDEVGHGREIDDDHNCLTDVRFATGDKCREEEEANGHRDCDDCEVEFEVGEVRAHDDEELHGEGEEEEKVELEESDVNLDCNVSGCLCLNDTMAKWRLTWKVRYRLLSLKSAEMFL